MDATVKDCLSRPGIRSILYRTAQQCFGRHTDPSTFSFEGGDLHIRIAFREEAHALKFQAALIDLKLGYLIMGVKCDVLMEKAFGTLEGLDQIWASDYDPDDSTSPS